MSDLKKSIRSPSKLPTSFATTMVSTSSSKIAMKWDQCSFLTSTTLVIPRKTSLLTAPLLITTTTGASIMSTKNDRSINSMSTS